MKLSRMVREETEKLYQNTSAWCLEGKDVMKSWDILSSDKISKNYPNIC